MKLLDPTGSENVLFVHKKKGGKQGRSKYSDKKKEKEKNKLCQSQ